MKQKQLYTKGKIKKKNRNSKKLWLTVKYITIQTQYETCSYNLNKIHN